MSLPREVTIRLESGLFETSYVGRVVERSVIESALGASLVEDDAALLFDITRRDSPAYKANIPRGARLMDVRRVRGGVEVTFEHESSRRQVRLKTP